MDTQHPITASSWSRQVWPLAALRDRLATPLVAPTVHLDVFRHGETIANARQIVSGSSDVNLTSRGRAEAGALGGNLGGRYDAAFHSSLTRSRETLELALEASAAEVALVVEDDRIVERSMGVLEGQPTRPLPAYDAGDLRWAPQGGEPYVDVAARVMSFLVDLLELARGADRPIHVVVSTHAGPMRILLAVATAAADPQAVLTGSFANARVSYIACRKLEWPPFLAAAV